MADPMVDLIEGIMRMQHAFRRHRMEPSIVELSSWDDGMRLKMMLTPEYQMWLGMNEKGEARMHVEIAGTIVRWPTQRKALRGGGFEYV